MERLTEYVTENCSKPFYRFRSDGEIYIRYRYCLNIEKAIDKLAEYENTGLEPSEIEKLKHERSWKMKEINILCVEDGSVDVESLENEGLHDGKVVTYRQGANPPFVLKLKTDDGELKSEQNKVAVEKLEKLLRWIDEHKQPIGYVLRCEINDQIKELKGE